MSGDMQKLCPCDVVDGNVVHSANCPWRIIQGLSASISSVDEEVKGVGSKLNDHLNVVSKRVLVVEEKVEDMEKVVNEMQK